MHIFETVLILLLGATVLSAIARRANIPYPTLLAVGGAAVALVPGTPTLELPPDLILALFVAPILLDAAHDASLRDLRANWRPVLSLVLVAVVLTTFAVAIVARQLFPDMPWAAAIALGAIVAPPDAVAALAILRQVDPPYRIRTVLEGESLLNDASALLIYKLAVGAVLAGSFSIGEAAQTFPVVVLASIAVGWLLSWPIGWFVRLSSDAPTSVILQFVTTFGVWLLAERLGLSGVVTTVVSGIALGRRTGLPAQLRVPSFAIWEAATFVLNVLAFTLIGLQIGPIVEGLAAADRWRFVGAALAVLATAIVIRMIWVMIYTSVRPRGAPAPAFDDVTTTPLTPRGGLVIGWSGMRGIVTLAGALALPAGFPYRDFIQLAAFTVVLGTLLLQGLTLRPLLRWLALPKDELVESEVALAHRAALKAAMAELDDDHSPAAERLRLEYQAALSTTRQGGHVRDTPENALRRRTLPASRQMLDRLRRTGRIGDDAYRRVEAELDWIELSATMPQEPP